VTSTDVGYPANPFDLLAPKVSNYLVFPSSDYERIF
jgi:hypothetical protein